MSTLAIIDLESGNLRSAAKAFEHMGAHKSDGVRVRVTRAPEEVAAADRVVLPGVGAFADCRRALDAIDGMRQALDEAVLRRGRPFLGICVGMQLMASAGREHASTPGLGWIPGEVRRIAPAPVGNIPAKIPHMGWNTLAFARSPLFEGGHPVLEGMRARLRGAPDVYFVHSYQLVPDDPRHVLATCDYGGPITACVGRDTMLGVQFHPEKSQAVGLAFIAAFLAWAP